MNQTIVHRSRRDGTHSDRFFAACIFTAVASLLLAAALLQLWRLDWRVPLAYRGDAIFYLMTIKGLCEGPWYLSNPHLAAPAGLDLRDFACADTLHFALLKLMALCQLPFPAIDTLFYLISFPLAAVCCLYALKRLGISLRCGIFASLVYSLAPYHFARGTLHLFLSMYYLVPLTLLTTLWVGAAHSPLFTGSGSADDKVSHPGAGERPCRVCWGCKDLKLSIAWCVLLGMTNVYYPFFTAVLLVTAGLYGAWRRSSRAPLRLTAVLLAAIVVSFLVNLAPNIAYSLAHGSNPQASPRSSADAEVFGLKITELVLPVSGHRVPILSMIKDGYDCYGSTAPEDEDAALGLVGAVGFACLLARLLMRHRTQRQDDPQGDGQGDGQGDRDDLPDDLAVYNIVALLVGTVGGLGSLFAFAISPDIRCYNRLSIYIAFLAVAAVAWWLDRQFERCSTPGGLTLLMVLALGFAALDQCPRTAVPDYSRVAAEWHRDGRFTSRIEALLPPNSMVFQLPYVSFPGSPPICRMTDYEQLCPYLHSRTLRWSCAAIRGRADDTWYRQVSEENPDQMLNEIQKTGFRGLYIDGFGYPDGGRSLTSALQTLLHEKPIVSQGGRRRFFTLPPLSRA